MRVALGVDDTLAVGLVLADSDCVDDDDFVELRLPDPLWLEEKDWLIVPDCDDETLAELEQLDVTDSLEVPETLEDCVELEELD